MRNYFLIVLAIAIGIGACKNQETGDTQETPEAVLRLFVEHMNKGDYENAKKLSTNPDYVNLIDQSYELDNSPIAQMEMKDVKCTEIKDSASCLCRFVFNGAEEEDSYPLVRRNGQWLLFTDDVGTESSELEHIHEEEYDQIIENPVTDPGKE